MIRFFTLVTCYLMIANFVFGQDADPQTKKSVLDGIKIGGEWFVGYFYDKNDGVSKNDFAIKRGYITIAKEFNKKFSARLTQDISVDQEGDGIGDIELRIKYAYAKYNFGDFWFLTNPSLEFGVVHRPWLSFEQKINRYRVQGRMFFERVGLVSSADYGLYFETLFGGKISEDYQKNVNKSFPGKYGSLGVGIYNGGGYNKLEYNKSKNIEMRATLRPLAEIIPGFQITYIGGFGKGNTAQSPEYILNAGYFSYENSIFSMSITYYDGKGLQDGSAVGEFGNSVDQDGYSGFMEVKIASIGTNFFGRYDYFKQNFTDIPYTHENYILGISYDLIETSRIILSYDWTEKEKGSSSRSSIMEATLELSF
jgi:hypothetical protein